MAQSALPPLIPGLGPRESEDRAPEEGRGLPRGPDVSPHQFTLPRALFCLGCSFTTCRVSRDSQSSRSRAPRLPSELLRKARWVRGAGKWLFLTEAVSRSGSPGWQLSGHRALRRASAPQKPVLPATVNSAPGDCRGDGVAEAGFPVLHSENYFFDLVCSLQLLCQPRTRRFGCGVLNSTSLQASGGGA